MILDDLGIERNTEYSLENLFNVIDARYVSGKPMIITTNLHINELMKNTLKGANAKAKANAAQGLPELIETASGVRFTPNTKPKHNKDAKHGWYRYESRFALPVFGDNGEVTRYNVFHVAMILRHAEDGKKYLYDIMNIKKETSSLFQP